MKKNPFEGHISLSDVGKICIW